MSKICVFCSDRIALSARHSCHQRARSGSQVKMICGEMFVFCSGLMVSLTFGVSCQRSRPSEIRWLNVKQPTSTRLRLERDRTRSQVKLVMSVSNGLWLDQVSLSLASGIGHERVELSSTQAPARTGPSSISNGISVRLSVVVSSLERSRARDVSCPAAHLSESSSR